MDESALYLGIDLAETGCNLKKLAVQHNYSVKELQELLHLSCPQPIYRWFKGKILPSADHLFVLARLFEVHMEELLVPKIEEIPVLWKETSKKHLYFYWRDVQASGI